ncbi:MAG: hypothetical protein UX45_C0014G0020 [Candidatus Uhrbacteria bacterium GW2011_GWF2_46_218]|uniref:Uncharacterized protein n=1 Tax=Candidatus Uhrbacteria bacterium GW2011_GWF2_46_218 TaxID=1619001 RepID=A0A0G1PIL7_9BACT|nr:MAG: hypothetical protein UX45_C0014G0020 [Candidatus Uhrbacteria bacterium GW2011_GWF2_46_218]
MLDDRSYGAHGTYSTKRKAAPGVPHGREKEQRLGRRSPPSEASVVPKGERGGRQRRQDAGSAHGWVRFLCMRSACVGPSAHTVCVKLTVQLAAVVADTPGGFSHKAANVARVYVTESLGRDFILVHPRGISWRRRLRHLGTRGVSHLPS